MGREVEQDAAAWPGRLAPRAWLQLRAIPVVIGFEPHGAPQGSFRHQFSKGLEIPIVATVLVDRNEPALFFRELHQRLSLLHSGRERLVHYDVPACCEALPREGIM